MYRSGLVSRRMALFGVVGGPLLAASGIAVLMGVIPQGSALQGIATVPEIIWEAFLGLWLTFKGFSPSPITSSYSASIGVGEARAAGGGRLASCPVAHLEPGFGRAPTHSAHRSRVRADLEHIGRRLAQPDAPDTASCSSGVR